MIAGTLADAESQLQVDTVRKVTGSSFGSRVLKYCPSCLGSCQHQRLRMFRKASLCSSVVMWCLGSFLSWSICVHRNDVLYKMQVSEALRPPKSHSDSLLALLQTLFKWSFSIKLCTVSHILLISLISFEERVLPSFSCPPLLRIGHFYHNLLLVRDSYPSPAVSWG